MQQPIPEWFEQHDGDDGDFCITPRSIPFDVVPPKDASDVVLYCTKQHSIHQLLHALEESNPNEDQPFATILRWGLPSESDAAWLAATVGSRRLMFLGDADPADLLIYVWLRERLRIEHIGLCDSLLVNCGVPFNEHHAIPMKPSEIAAMPLVEQYLGDLLTALGPWIGGLLASGRKVEIEALFSFATCGPDRIAASIVDSGT